MAGVGSTNAMKKGSGNNPFLAFSEADMQGYLNSAYTGCIVKYSGEAIKRQITDINKTVGEYAQNLVFDTTKLGLGAIVLPAAIKIDITKNGSSTTQYIYEGWVKDGKVYTNAVVGSTNMLVLASSLNSGADVITVINNGRWQREAVNDQGKLTLWSYSEDVLFTVIPDANGSLAPFERFVSIVPYIVGELYKVVYGDGVYYYEEFYYISEDRTTGNSDYLAPGKTMYDFTGSLQTGNGGKINPYIANTVDEMNSYLTLAYKGAFVKYVGTSTADYTKDAVYQVADDGDTTRYAILPTLSNKGKASDLAAGKQLINSQGEVVEGVAAGKQLINSQGEVVEGEAATQGDIVAKYMQRQLTEFVTSNYISAIGFDDYSRKDKYMTFSNQSMLTKFDCQNIGKIWAGAFVNCDKLSYLKLAEDVDIEGCYYDGRWNAYLGFPNQMYVNDARTNRYIDFGTSEDKYANLASMYNYDSSITYLPKRLLPGAVSSNRYVKTINWSTVKYASPFAIVSCANLSDLSLPNLINVPQFFIRECQALKQINVENCKVINRYAFATNYALEKVICPNVEEVHGGAFESASKLIEPYSFPKCKMFSNPYNISVSISSVYLPEAVDVTWIGACKHIESVYMPKVQTLLFATSKITSLSLPECKSLNLNYAETLKNVYAPMLQTLVSVIGCRALEELNFSEVIYASSSYATSLPYLYVSGCVSLKNISFAKYNGVISISSAYLLETINCPALKQLTLYGCSNIKDIKCPAATSISASAIVTSNFSINIDSSEYTYCNVNLSNAAGGSYNVDINILNVNSLYRSCRIYLSGDAINNLYVAIPIDGGTDYLFSDWSMPGVRKFSLSSNVQAMPAHWFSRNTRLTDVNLYNVSSIANYAFYLCENISAAYMPETVIMNYSAFYGCSKLEYMILLKSSCSLGGFAIANTPMSESSYLGRFGSIYVPASYVQSYKSAIAWSLYSSRITSITDLPQELKDKYNLNGVE